jgi:glutamyl-tRNA synthetase
MGYLDSAILNTLARLGWSKGNKEVFYLKDLIKDFEINEVQKAGAIFDITKLDYLNIQHMANLNIEDFIKELIPYTDDIGIDLNSHSKKVLLIESLRSSSSNLKGVALSLRPYFFEVSEYDQKAISKFIDNVDILSNLKDSLVNVKEWSETEIDKTLKTFQESSALSTPKVNQPIRIALTGSTQSPSLGLTLSLFDQKTAVNRIIKLQSYLNK